MMTIKIVCVCGQKYAFDVEPYQGRMPAAVACPVCGVDGTARANEIMAQQLSPAARPVARMTMPVNRPAAASAAPATATPLPAAPAAQVAVAAPAAPAAAVAAPRAALPAVPAAPPMVAATAHAAAQTAVRSSVAFPAAADDDEGPGGKGDTWKWWYYILAGIGIGGYSVWQAYDQQRLKPLGELFLAGLLIAIGIWDFQRKRKRKRA